MKVASARYDRFLDRESPDWCRALPFLNERKQLLLSMRLAGAFTVLIVIGSLAQGLGSATTWPGWLSIYLLVVSLATFVCAATILLTSWLGIRTLFGLGKTARVSSALAQLTHDAGRGGGAGLVIGLTLCLPSFVVPTGVGEPSSLDPLGVASAAPIIGGLTMILWSLASQTADLARSLPTPILGSLLVGVGTLLTGRLLSQAFGFSPEQVQYQLVSHREDQILRALSDESGQTVSHADASTALDAFSASAIPMDILTWSLAAVTCGIAVVRTWSTERIRWLEAQAACDRAGLLE